METFSLKVGLVVTLHGAKLRLRKSLGNGMLLWTNELDEPSKMKESDFYSMYDSRELFIDDEQPHLGMLPTVRNAPPDITCFPENHAAVAFRRRSYLVRLIDSVGLMLPSNRYLSDLIQEVAKDIGDPLTPPSVSTVRRWFNLFQTGSIVKLVPHHSDKGRSRIIQGELEDLVSDVIETDYLTLERPLVSPAYEKLRSQIEKVNEGRLPSLRLVIPSEMTFRRYIDSMDPYELDKGRLGKHAANQIHRTAIGKLVVEKILDRWEIDHTPLDILVVDAKTGKHIGRPFLTIVLDRHSRMIMAYLIHFAAPNTESVLRAIERAIRPKATWLARFPSVLSEWRAHGLPSRIVPDNAAEFHADDLINAFNELGIEIMYPASRAPQKKGAVERFFRTLNDGLIHRLPGTTFSNTRERGDYPSEALACLTLEDLETELVKWIVDVYHQRTHRGLPAQMTPAQAWLAGEAHRHICLPTDLDALESVLARRKRSPVHHYGVEVGTHVYHSAELAELKMKLDDGEKVEVRYRDELGHVWIHDRFRNVFILVAAKDKRLIGLSRETYDLAREKLRHAGKRSPSFEAVHQAYQDIMNDVADLKRSQKTRERREAAKVKLDRSGVQQPSVQLNSEKPADFVDGDIETDAIPGYSVVSRVPQMRKS